MSAKHTPGPWTLEPNGWESQGIFGDDVRAPGGRRFIVDVSLFHDGAEANARLIAAAPDLLEVLRITAGNIRSLGPAGALAAVHEPYSQWLAAVEAVIAKATGGQA